MTGLEVVLIVLVLSILGNIALAFVAWRMWQQTERNDDVFTAIHRYLNNLHVMCVAVLTRPIYSDDVLVRAFVDVIKDIEPYLLSLNDELYFDEEVPQAAKELEGYNQTEEKEEEKEDAIST